MLPVGQENQRNDLGVLLYVWEVFQQAANIRDNGRPCCNILGQSSADLLEIRTDYLFISPFGTHTL